MTALQFIIGLLAVLIGTFAVGTLTDSALRARNAWRSLRHQSRKKGL